MTSQRFFVIGSNSFSGASFVAGALGTGAEVCGISRSLEADPVFLPYQWEAYGGGARGSQEDAGSAAQYAAGPRPVPVTARFAFRQLDLNRDLDQVEAAVRDFRPDYVVNFAAQGMVAQSWSCPEQWYQTNTVAMARLHDRLRRYGFIKKFVQASTPEVYGHTSGLVRENAPLNPSTPYAISKAACDMHLLALHNAYGFPAVFTRSANVCGPAQALYRIVPKTILSILTGKKLKLEGGGLSVRSFIHIDDVVEGTLRVARDGSPGHVYHLATDRNQTIRALVEEICRQLDVAFDDCVETGEPRLGQDGAYLLDCTKARTELGWVPTRTVADAIRDTAAWLRKNLDVLRRRPDQYLHKA